jgi:hypothetical protein
MICIKITRLVPLLELIKHIGGQNATDYVEIGNHFLKWLKFNKAINQ